MRPPKHEPMASFDSFLEAVFDPLLAAAGAASGLAAATGSVVDDEGYKTAESGSDSEEEEEEEFEVEAILNKRQVRGRTQLLVKWKGYGPKHNSWEPLDAVNADELLPAFDRAQRLGGARGRLSAQVYEASLLQRKLAYAVSLVDACLEGSEAVLSTESQRTVEPDSGYTSMEDVDPSDDEEVLRAVVELHSKQQPGGSPARLSSTL
jgi:hypothetical protein